MPSLIVTSIGQTGAQWYVTGLGYPWTTEQYRYVYVSLSNGSSSPPVYPPSSGSSYSTGWGSISGLSPGTYYTARALVVAASGIVYDGGSYSFYTQAAPQPPIGTPSVSADATYSNGQHYINVYWTSVNGATGYQIYANSYYKTTSYGTSAQITVDSEYTLYSIAVIPYNGAGNGSAGTVDVRSKDVTPPVLSSFSASNIGSNTVTVSASATDSGSGVSGFYFYRNGTHTGTVYGASVDYSYTELTPQTAYTLTCRAFDGQSNLSPSSEALTVTTKSNRPANFSWTNAKTSGENFNLLAIEWNALAERINTFRSYKGLAGYSFTTALTGNNYEAYYFNQATTAIGAMSPPTAAPSSVSSGQTIYDSQLNGLVNSLNSIL